MNVWRFDDRIFDACRDVPLSARGEYELPGSGRPRGRARRQVPRRAGRRRGARSVATKRRGAGQRTPRRAWSHGHELDRAAFRVARHAGGVRGLARGACSHSSSNERRRSSRARPNGAASRRAGSRSSASTPITPAAIRCSPRCRAASRSSARRRADGIVRVGDIFDGQVIEVDPVDRGAGALPRHATLRPRGGAPPVRQLSRLRSRARTSRSPATCRAHPA